MLRRPASQPAGLALAALLLFAAAAQARFAAIAEPVPVARLVENVGRYVRAHPEEARGHYTLGRIHSLAFARETPEVAVVIRRVGGGDPQPLPTFPPYESVLTPRASKGDALAPASREHLASSLREYSEATRLAPKEGLYWMGLGWMLEQGAPFAGQVALPPSVSSVVPGVLPPTPLPAAPGTPQLPGPARWRAAALEAYRRAYRLTRDAELRLPDFGPRADFSVSLEAAEGLLRLLPADPNSPAVRAERDDLRTTVAKLRSKPRAVTPILFTLSGGGSLEELLDPRSTVRFDLAGKGRRERWPWVRPDTCILVWDPEHTGRIRSGRQLFGSFTWSMFWSDGYEPLAALDDDGDGFLTGPELAGLAVWRDRNGNGVSDPGEVRPLSDFGIRAMAVRQRLDLGGGVVLKGTMLRDGGGWIRTYDWVPTSLPAAAAGRPKERRERKASGRMTKPCAAASKG